MAAPDVASYRRGRPTKGDASMTSPTQASDAGIAAQQEEGGFLDRLSARSGMSKATLSAGALLPFLAIVVILAVIGIAPDDQRSTIFFASLIAVAAGLSSTAIGVYGGVLVPGLLLIPGIDARFAA